MRHTIIAILVTTLLDSPAAASSQTTDPDPGGIKFAGVPIPSYNPSFGWGIGALVSISAGGRRQARQITRTASFAGSTLPVALFGLGESTTIDRLEVRWPSGARSVREDLAVDRQVTVREAEGG